MFGEAEEGAIQSDVYIDALLAGHARLPVPLPVADDVPVPNVRHIARLLERGLPRFHPSFLFEERLAEQLRAAYSESGATQVILDRRLLMGGALASGVSVAGAVVWVWRRRRD